MEKYVGLNSTVKVLYVDLFEKDSYTIVLKAEKDNEISLDTSMAQALMWHIVGDTVIVKNKGGNDEKGTRIKILAIENPVGIKQYYESHYGNIECDLKRLKNGINLFPFEHRLYIGNKGKYNCKCGCKEWEIVDLTFFHKSGAKLHTVYCCKQCKRSVIDSLPYKEEHLYDFYKVFYLDDEKPLNEKQKGDLTQQQVQYWQSLVIQGGTFMGK